MADPTLNGLPYNPIFKRIVFLLGSDKQIVIAKALGMSQASISNMIKDIMEKKPGALENATWVARFYWRLNVNPRWLLLGDGFQYVPRAHEEVITDCKTELLQQELLKRMPEHHLVWVKKAFDVNSVQLS